MAKDSEETDLAHLQRKLCSTSLRNGEKHADRKIKRHRKRESVGAIVSIGMASASVINSERNEVSFNRIEGSICRREICQK